MPPFDHSMVVMGVKWRVRRAHEQQTWAAPFGGVRASTALSYVYSKHGCTTSFGCGAHRHSC